MTIMAATQWKTNADLIVACVELGYIRSDVRTLDPTYGRGKWWTKFRPDELVYHHKDIDGIYFTQLPHDDCSFGQAAFDPPYVATGSRDKTKIPDFFDRYGMDDCPANPAGVQCLINGGLEEMLRVVEPRGIVVVKCQDYVSSGKLWLGTHHTLSYALDLGFTCIDRLEHVSRGGRAQPKNRTRLDKATGQRVPSKQKHARRNLSTMFVLEVPGRRRKRQSLKVAA